MKKTINYLALFIFSIFIISCGKDEDVTNNEENNNTNNSKIEYKELNYTTTANIGYDTTASLSILGNTLSIIHEKIVFSTENVYTIDLKFSGNAFFQKQTNASLSSTHQTSIVKVHKKDSLIGITDNLWFYTPGVDPITVNTLYYSSNEGTAGIHGVGDVYVAFRVKEASDDSYRYGWIRISLNSDRKTLTIKDAALSKESNKEIKAGEK